MKQYLDLLSYVFENGIKRSIDVQGVGNKAILGYENRFDLSKGFPLLTTKKVNFHYVLGELLWFLTGESRVDFLRKNNIPIWDSWATKEVCDQVGLKEGDFGPIYGPQWIHWKRRDGNEINQIKDLVEEIMSYPYSKRMMVTSWNPEDVAADRVFIAPCHGIFKCCVLGNKLHLHMFQRSADVFVGVPFNIASYSLLLMMLAQVTGYEPGEFVHTTSDTHLYLNLIKQTKIQLQRKPKQLPKVNINPEVKNIFDFTFEDFELVGYDPHKFIKVPVAL